MHRRMKKFSLIACLFLVASCAAPTVQPPRFDYAEESIKIHVKADSELNRYQGSPHTLMACVYQLTSRNSLNQLSGDRDGLYKLLECSMFDSSVTNVERLIIQPGQQATMVFDRADNTRYVAVVAGYNNMYRDGVVRFFDIPIKSETTGFISKTTSESLDILNINLILGPERINN